MLTLHTERGTKPSPTHNNKMKAKVTTINEKAAIEFEAFLRSWDVEFDFYASKTDGFTYTFDDQDDRNAFITEARIAIPGNLFNELNWK